MSELRIRTVLEPTGPAGAILLTDEQVAELGAGKTPPVTVTIGGQTVRVRLARMKGQNMIGFRRELREQLGLELGQEVDAIIAVDTAERTVDVPEPLSEALAKEKLRDAFDAWSFTKRKEAARGVADAKKDETKAARVEKVLAELRG